VKAVRKTDDKQLTKVRHSSNVSLVFTLGILSQKLYFSLVTIKIFIQIKELIHTLTKLTHQLFLICQKGSYICQSSVPGVNCLVNQPPTSHATQLQTMMMSIALTH